VLAIGHLMLQPAEQLEEVDVPPPFEPPERGMEICMARGSWSMTRGQMVMHVKAAGSR